MRNIYVENPIDIKSILKEYDKSIDSVVRISIGCDNLLYLLLSHKIPERINGMFVDTKADTFYDLLILTVDWLTGELLYQRYYKLGRHQMNFHFVQPLKDKILLLGARTYHYSDGPENNAVIVDKNGTIYNEMCLGDGIEDCIVTNSGQIITSYFDEGIFGNYGWDTPIGSCGLIIWEDSGTVKWQAKYPIYDCYAINIDEKENLWFYFYDEFALVKTDFHSDIIFHPEISGASGFLLTSDGRYIIFDGGYNRHFQFTSAQIKHDKLTDYEGTDIIYNGKNLLLKRFAFRSSKAVFWDNENRLFAKDIIQF